MTTNENANYRGKVAFVTGAASGIDRATALAFAREGASVVAGLRLQQRGHRAKEGDRYPEELEKRRGL